ncbi:hypothetical protein G9A89_007679 [Geosiphon pyriformis]|nr:hypothetical protein G9A89_007679 [Geosiphon pyriformis]
MDLVSASAGGFGLGLTGLEIHLSAKSNTSHKKPKKSVTSVSMVNSFAGLLNLVDIDVSGRKSVILWSSKVGSINSSVSRLSDVKDMANTIAKETSYTELNKDNNIDDTTLKKTRTQTYVLGNLPNDNDEVLELPLCVIVEFNQLLLLKSRAQKDGVSIQQNLFKKIFYQVDGFGGASTPSKFLEIIRLSFIFESSLKKAKKLAVSENILVNDDVKQINKCLNWEIVVKKISVNLSKLVVKSVFFKFGKIVSIKIQLISLWQKAFVKYELSELADLVTVKWNHHWALLYILSIGTTVHDLSDLLDSYGRKTCIIGHNLSSYVHDKCAVVCFANEASKLAAIGFTPVFKNVNLYWASLSLVCCTLCKQFGYFFSGCFLGENSGVHGRQVVTVQDQICLANIYKKKQAPIAHPVQVADGFSLHVVLSFFSGTDLSFGIRIFSAILAFFGNFDLYDHLASLEHSVGLLLNQVSSILRKLSFVKLVSLSGLNSNMAMNNVLVPSVPLFIDVNVNVSGFSSNNSKVLTTKVDGLESKMMTLDASINLVLVKLDRLCSGLGFDLVWKIATCNVKDINNPVKQADIIHWHKGVNNLISVVTETKLKDNVCSLIINKFDDVWVFTSGLDSGHLGSGVAIIIDNLLARHVYKVSEISGRLFTLKLLFKNKLFVSILGLYAAGDINSMIVKAVNKFSFIVLGGDFNKNSSHKYINFKKCLDFGLVNFLNGSSYVKTLIWTNSWGVAKIINFLFIFLNLVNIVADCNVFDAVSMLVGLDGLFDVRLNFFCKQVNKNCWRFDYRDADNIRWVKFKEDIAANAVMFYNEFFASKKHSDLDAMWNALHRRIESFELNKSYTIRSVLEHLFHKVVLDYLAVNGKLILDPNLIKAKYVFDDAFSDVMYLIGFDEMIGVISNLFDGKVAGLFNISNELWKHCNKTGYLESQAGLTSFLAAGVFVDNTIWIVLNWKTFKQWKRLDLYGPIPNWFELSVYFLNDVSSSFICLPFSVSVNLLNILKSHEFGVICDHLLGVNASCFSVYTDSSLSSLRTPDIKAGVAVFFEDIGLGLGVKVFGLVFSTMAKLQAVTLALECIFSSSSVQIFSDS